MRDLARSCSLWRLPSASEWVCLAAGSFLIVHYAWLMDDAFVYFRYVDNFLFLKLGLVYNAGEYVEGFSSPLWLILLTAGRALGTNYWLLLRILGLASFAGFWMLMVATHRRLSRDEHLNLPLILLTFNYAVLSSFTSGLETPLVQLASAAFAWHLVKPRSRLGQVLVGLSPLVRHELILPWLLSVGWARHRKGAWPRWSIFVALLSLAGWALFRIVYYAALLPNTFYLKDMNWIAQGLRYVWDTAFTYGLFLILPLAGLSLWVLQRRGRVLPQLGARGMMVVLALSVMAYVVKIGGDFLHYRYLAFCVPLLLLPLSGLVQEGVASLAAKTRRWLLPAIGLAAAAVTCFLYPSALDGHPYTLRGGYLSGGVLEDAMTHRLRPELARDPWESGGKYDKRSLYREYRRRRDRHAFDRIVADYWCVRNYEHFNWYVVQSLGLTDPVLSRIDVPNQRPGHRWHLHPLGQQLAELRGKYGFGPGLYEKAIAAGDAPDWIRANREALRVIDRRAYNRHRFFENLALAFERPGRLHLVSPPPEVPLVRVKKLGS